MKFALEAYTNAETQKEVPTKEDHAEDQIESNNQGDEDQENAEEWLRHYMIGKIKEKLTPLDLMACLNHYRIVFNFVSILL